MNTIQSLMKNCDSLSQFCHGCIIGVAEYLLQFPKKDMKDMINREIEEFKAKKSKIDGYG